MRKPISVDTRRVLTIVLSFPFFLVISNYFFDWGFIDGYAKHAMIGSWVGLALIVLYVAPTVEELIEYREGKNRQ